MPEFPEMQNNETDLRDEISVIVDTIIKEANDITKCFHCIRFQNSWKPKLSDSINHDNQELLLLQRENSQLENKIEFIKRILHNQEMEMCGYR